MKSLFVEQVQFLAWFKADGLARSNGHLGARARVATDSGFARAHIEDAETSQFDAVAGGKCLFQAFKHCVHRRFGFIARQARTFDDVMDNVLFYQRVHPYL